ncbi:glycosyltransferase family 58 protein [Xylona heveae TC161]|uniref:Dol-P-Man:Man(5)GlcNAc(2)-PP-Dol alpha-1,3-mannosyltransferase n=1 Tax=Xylona heveae (strain CBS 132557 / TC161) TaxID=1328760 RepID=A0A164ZPI7_XYLHT|nr:glycosyltransferase family 58 protein [Xylona heveae TC161]KZF19345.1 glycosyltransferase family 58 protein [Xylona heveae TC161]
MDLINRGIDIATNPKHTRWISPLLLATDAALCALVIWKIPYTEIDWKAYMEQVELYLNGERDYLKIRGGTGPLVYPAAHVYIYSALYHLTNYGQNILLAQSLFAILYLLALALVMACYRMAKAPPYIFPLLVLSKRLHSIFLLRLFNDCWAVAALFLAIYAYQKRQWTIGSIVYALGLGTKMSLLLALPAIGLILFQGIFTKRALNQAQIMLNVQLALAMPFIGTNPWGYLSRAFEFSRQFLFKWTVNWRFIGEETFLSKKFSTALLLAHVVVLLIFISTRWTKPLGYSASRAVQVLLRTPPLIEEAAISSQITPDFILTTILTANAIGMLFARSLHYQFYSLIAWATPFLAWKAGYHPVLQYALWAAQEWAWNVYPSTDISSKIVVGALAVTVNGVWWGTREKAQKRSVPSEERKGQ